MLSGSGRSCAEAFGFHAAAAGTAAVKRWRSSRHNVVEAHSPVTLDITDLNHRGEGVGRWQGMTVFVRGAFPGDRVRAVVLETRKSYARARLQDVLIPSPHRVPAPCPVAGVCGGCQLQGLAYPAQLAWKQRYVREVLRRIGGLDVEVAPAAGMDHPWGYRNKAQFPLGTRGGKLVAGCFEPGTHDIVEIDRCALQHEANNRALAAARSLLEELRIPVYDELADRGFARHLVTRVGARTEEIMGVVVTRYWRPRGAVWPGAFPGRWMGAVPGLVSVYQNLNPRRTNVIMGEEDRLLLGKPVIEDRLLGLTFRISPHSFYQVNPHQAEVMYTLVRNWAGLGESELALDVYCGVGTIALVLAAQGAQVVGIEEVAAAVQDARENARANGLDHVQFVCGKAEDVLPGLMEKRLPQVVVLDPPRQGVARTVLEALLKAGPPRVIYVSCAPATLARDLAVLVQGGYRVLAVQPVDMFPQTAHVESVARLEKG